MHPYGLNEHLSQLCGDRLRVEVMGFLHRAKYVPCVGESAQVKKRFIFNKFTYVEFPFLWKICMSNL